MAGNGAIVADPHFHRFFLEVLSPDGGTAGKRDRIREKIFKNYALKSIEAVHRKREEATLYVERDPELVRSITDFSYIVRSI